jgi:peptidoglycan/xylan/chitin deacetylase (PgdA/CDA1 family)
VSSQTIHRPETSYKGRVFSLTKDAAKARIRDAVGATLWAAGITNPGKRSRDHLTVVTFHRVLSDAERASYPMPTLAVTEAELRWFLRFFKENYECVTVSAGLARIGRSDVADKPLLALTFDDGTVDNFTAARPCVNAEGLPATFYVVAGEVEQERPLWHDAVSYAFKAAPAIAAASLESLTSGSKDGASAVTVLKTCDADRVDEAVLRLTESLRQAGVDRLQPTWDGLMNWSQLKQLVKDGHEVGAHSAHHAILTNCSVARLVRETEGARSTLEDRLGVPVRSFCYPNGDHNDAVVEAVKAGGYKNAVTTVFGVVPRGADGFRLRRCDIQSATSRTAGGRLSRSRLAWRLSGIHPGLR